MDLQTARKAAELEHQISKLENKLKQIDKADLRCACRVEMTMTHLNSYSLDLGEYISKDIFDAVHSMLRSHVASKLAKVQAELEAL